VRIGTASEQSFLPRSTAEKFLKPLPARKIASTGKMLIVAMSPEHPSSRGMQQQGNSLIGNNWIREISMHILDPHD
jgi:hypothetical protein